MRCFKKTLHISEAISKPSAFTGLCLALVSGVFYATSGAIVKVMSNIHPAQLTAYRFVAIFLFSIPEAIASCENLFGPSKLRLHLIIVSVGSAISFFLNFVAFQNLPLGEASVIIFSLPVFVTIAARIFLKEPFGVVHSIIVILTFVGILFTAQIPDKLSGKKLEYTKPEIYGLLAAVASLACKTWMYLELRKLKSIHHSIIMLNIGWIGVVSMLILTALMGNFKLHYCGNQQSYLIVFFVFSYTGGLFLTKALQCEYAGPVSTIRAAADIMLSFLWQVFYFKHEPNIFGIVGAFMVSVSVIFIGLRKYVLSLEADSKCLLYMKWITL